MRAKWLVMALCIGGAAALACNETVIQPLNESEKPSTNEVVLMAPFLEYVPCERNVGVAWKLAKPVRTAEVTIDVLYFESVTNAYRPGSRLPNNVQAGSWKLVSKETLGEDYPSNGSCCWQVPALECDLAVLQFTVTNAAQGNDPLVESFAVGAVQVPNSHQPPTHDID